MPRFSAVLHPADAGTLVQSECKMPLNQHGRVLQLPGTRGRCNMLCEVLNCSITMHERPSDCKKKGGGSVSTLPQLPLSGLPNKKNMPTIISLWHQYSDIGPYTNDSVFYPMNVQYKLHRAGNYKVPKMLVWSLLWYISRCWIQSRGQDFWAA